MTETRFSRSVYIHPEHSPVTLLNADLNKDGRHAPADTSRCKKKKQVLPAAVRWSSHIIDSYFHVPMLWKILGATFEEFIWSSSFELSVKLISVDL